MTMATFLTSSVERCDGGHGITLWRSGGLPTKSDEGEGEDHGHLPPSLSRELWRWSWPMPSPSEEEGVYPSSPREERVITMATFLPSSVESCEGGHGLGHHLLEKRRSALLVRIMTGDPWTFSSLPQWRVMEKVEADLLGKRRPALLVLGRKGTWPWPYSSFPRWRLRR